MLVNKEASEQFQVSTNRLLTIKMSCTKNFGFSAKNISLIMSLLKRTFVAVFELVENLKI